MNGSYDWKISIQGPDESPYKKGTFLVRCEIPAEYPFKPPKFQFQTKIYHPNIDEKGFLCEEFVQKQWSPQLKIGDLVEAILDLLQKPDGTNPINPKAAEQFSNNQSEFKKEAAKWTAKYAS